MNFFQKSPACPGRWLFALFNLVLIHFASVVWLCNSSLDLINMMVGEVEPTAECRSSGPITSMGKGTATSPLNHRKLELLALLETERKKD